MLASLRLALRLNDIGDAGAAALSSALTGCKQLETLYLRIQIVLL
jgi:hypothetical protein